MIRFLIVLMIFSSVPFSSFATEVKSKSKAVAPAVKKEARSVAREPVNCAEKLKQAIRLTVRAMGEKQKIGFQLDEGDSVGKDLEGSELTLFSTTMFAIDIPDGGYISNSGGSVIVRDAKTKCEIVKVEVNLGVPPQG